jgi:hypothetical protein
MCQRQMSWFHIPYVCSRRIRTCLYWHLALKNDTINFQFSSLSVISFQWAIFIFKKDTDFQFLYVISFQWAIFILKKWHKFSVYFTVCNFLPVNDFSLICYQSFYSSIFIRNSMGITEESEQQVYWCMKARDM